MAKKATKAQMEQRIRVVYELLLADTPRPDICQYVAKNWGGSGRTADRYIQRANELIIQEANRMRENALEKHLAQRASLRNKALKEGDKRLAFDILRDETKLLGIYPAEKREVTGKDGGALFSIDDLTRARRELEDWENADPNEAAN